MVVVEVLAQDLDLHQHLVKLPHLVEDLVEEVERVLPLPKLVLVQHQHHLILKVALVEIELM
jgi:hypothetical protein